MDSVNKTLYIPLYGKALVSRKGIILHDSKAAAIWAAEGFPLKGKSRSKWLAYYMGMRSAVFDRWVAEMLNAHPGACVLHIGCGMDCRAERVPHTGNWFDVDFPQVIAERRRYYQESDSYRMLESDIRVLAHHPALPRGGDAILVLEGISMYLPPEELTAALEGICARFDRCHILMDCYTEFAARASKYRNPINDVGVTKVYGMDGPELSENIRFLRAHSMTPEDLISQLSGMEKAIFKKLYAGSFAQKMYRLYEYQTG